MKFKKNSKTTKSEEDIVPIEQPNIIKNNGAFKRAMTQTGIKSGDKVIMVYEDGSRYQVEGL